MGVLGGELFVFGGDRTMRSVERFNPKSGWEEEKELESKFVSGGAVFLP